jgi:Na+/proline symporter
VQTFIACLLVLGVSSSLLFVIGGSRKSQEEFRLSDRQVKWLWCLGLVMGPLWTGSTVGQPKIMHSGHLIVLVLGLVNCVL